MKIVFMGTPEFSVPILEKLHQEYGVCLVVTQPDKLVGRKKRLTYSEVKEKALELNIEVFQPTKIKEDYQRIIDVNPDIIITAAYGQIIPQEVLDFPRLGAINVHGSLLPKLRGGAPIQRAIKRMHKTTGITIMYMAMKMDSGDIISQREIPILDTDTSKTLFDKLSILGRDLLLETLPSIIDQTNQRIKQNEEEVTYAYNLKREEEQIDFSQTKEEIDAHLRAFFPSPCLYHIVEGKELKIIEISTGDFLNQEMESLENGVVTVLTKKQLGIKVKNGIVYLKKVKLAGKNEQAIHEFINGTGRNLIKPNKVFK
jgi:methionyl-tRNA formyltransferase